MPRLGDTRIQFSKAQDDLMREYYGKFVHASAELVKLPEFRGVDRGSISRRAARLGLARTRMSEREKQLIQRYAGEKPIADIQRMIERLTGTKRSYWTIVNYVNAKLGMSAKADTYSVDDLMIGFRVGRPKVLRWISKGVLRATRDKVAMGSPFRIAPIDVARFLVNHPFELEGVAVDVPWMVALLMEFKGQIKERISGREGRDEES